LLTSDSLQPAASFGHQVLAFGQLQLGIQGIAGSQFFPSPPVISIQHPVRGGILSEHAPQKLGEGLLSPPQVGKPHLCF
jgi:hypothetical protein